MANETSIKWTPQQLAGITTTGVNLLVSAAAGSGKTAVLAERCVYLVCDAKPPCSVDELLVVTFTEATAAEMKKRIGAALQKRHDADPENPRLQSQVAQIDRAQVSTLHGFCSRLLRRHFHLVGLDPAFVLLDGNDAKLLRVEVVRDLFTERYESDETGVFQKLIDIYADGNDPGLQQHVLRTHELLCSVTDPAQWIESARADLAEAAEKPLKDTILGRELAALVHRRLAALFTRCESAASSLRPIEGLSKTVAYISSLGDIIHQWTTAFGDGNFDALAKSVAIFSPAKQPIVPSAHAQKATASAAVDSVRDEMGKKGELYSLSRFSTTEWQAGVASLLPYANTFLDLVVEFRTHYQAAKTRTRSIDFADLERLALEVLGKQEAGDRWMPSPVAQDHHRRIAHVLVDEYQDINAVQDAILRLVSRECLETTRTLPPNLFCVGDVKQSIYGFRLAEPERFLSRYRRYREAGGGGRVIDLQENFRSRAPLLGAINALFEKLMTREAADIDYDQSQRLIPGATFPASDPPELAFIGAPIELHLIPRKSGDSDIEIETDTAEPDRTEREALFIAHRIQQLIATAHVADKGPDGVPASRPIEYRDIVILLRSAVFKAEQIAEILQRTGIPVHRDSGSGFFNTPEIRDLLALLQLLDNAKQDIPLVTVLRSPLSGFSNVEDTLARIRLAHPNNPEPVPFHEALVRYARDHNDADAARLKTFLASLDRWRSIALRRPLSELIWTLLEDTGYLAFCSGLENGEQRCANLLHLHDRAKQFADVSGRGLYRFLRSLDRLRDEADLGVPSVLGDGENVVRVMSIHKSKGLEFPVVFLPDLGKKFNLQDTTARVLVDRVRHLGLPAFDEIKQVRYPSLASVLVEQRLRQQMMAEELRILYVAMTRAKEHLILVGTCDEKQMSKWQTLWSNHRGPLAADVVLDAKNPLEWIGPVAVALQSQNPPPFELLPRTAAEVTEWNVAASCKAAPSLWQLARIGLKPLDPPPQANAQADALIQRLTYEYPHLPATARRAAMPATEWAKNQPAKKSAVISRLLPVPQCIATDPEIAATDRGAATHLVLQHLKFREDCTGDALAHQITHMELRRLITPAQTALVDTASIEWFIATDLGQQLRRADDKDLIREIPFSIAWPQSPTDTGLDRQMIRGRIDLLLRTGTDCIVVDYKTDRLTADEVPSRAATYAPQVALYRDALHRLTNLKVSAIYLAFLHPKALHKVE